MNNIKSLLFAIGATAVVTACNDNGLELQNQSEQTEITFSANISDGIQESGNTKTYLQGLSTLWTAGDQISVNGTAISLKSGQDTRYGVFQGTVSAYSGGYYAGYPASATTFSAGTMTLTIPATQTYNASNPLLGQMPMAAYAKADANGNVALNFKNAANILKLNLWGESGTNVKQIVISSSSAALSGTLTVNTSTTPITFGDITENQGTLVTLTCTDAVTLSTDQNDPTPFYVILPKLSGNANLTVKIYNRNGQYQQSTITVDGEHNVQLKDNANRLFATSSKKFIPGALNGVFSVSATQTVHFSQGNLWCNNSGASPNKWHFENDQYEYQNSWNANHSSYFYWNINGTYGAAQTYATATSETTVDWGQAVTADLGVGWYTMSQTEWNYLLTERTNAGSKVGFATVAGKNGLIILPDSFTDPMKNSGSGAFVPKATTGWTANVYTTGGNWEAMEAAGAVFLPVYGYRNGTDMNNTTSGYYWTSTNGGTYDAYLIYIGHDEVNISYDGNMKYHGRFVRLVHNEN